MSKLDDIKAARAERKAELERQREEQEAVDLEALNSLEIQHGDARVFPVEVATYIPGHPTFVVMRLPDRDEIARYQHANKPHGNKPGDPLASAKLMAATCVLYPDKEGWQALLDVQPGIDVIAGVAAVQRVAGRVEEEGKS